MVNWCGPIEVGPNVHLGVNQVLGFLYLSELFLNCMFFTVKTCLQTNLLLVILLYRTNMCHVFFLLFWNDPDNYLMCF